MYTNPENYNIKDIITFIEMRINSITFPLKLYQNKLHIIQNINVLCDGPSWFYWPPSG